MFGLWATGRTFECIIAKSHLHINIIKSNNNVEEHSLVELHHYIEYRNRKEFCKSSKWYNWSMAKLRTKTTILKPFLPFGS